MAGKAQAVERKHRMAPQPMLGPTEPAPMNRVLSVFLAEWEDVEWVWATTNSGGSFVCGYRIVPKWPKGFDLPRDKGA